MDMLATLGIVFVVVLTAVGAMSVGVVFTGRRIKGSCGGLSAVGAQAPCSVCGKPVSDSPCVSEAKPPDNTASPSVTAGS